MARRAIAIVLTGLLLVVVAWVAQTYAELSQAMNRADLRQNAITKYVIDQGAGRHWGTLVSLIPEPFAPNSSRTDVEQRLASAGFARFEVDDFLAHFHPDLQRREVYVREANTLVCNIQLYVFVFFDEAGELTLADATQHERGCS